MGQTPGHWMARKSNNRQTRSVLEQCYSPASARLLGMRPQHHSYTSVFLFVSNRNRILQIIILLFNHCYVSSCLHAKNLHQIRSLVKMASVLVSIAKKKNHKIKGLREENNYFLTVIESKSLRFSCPQTSLLEDEQHGIPRISGSRWQSLVFLWQPVSS